MSAGLAFTSASPPANSSGQMRLFDITGERPDDFFICVDNDIQDKGKFRLPGGINHIGMHGVAFQDLRSRFIMVNKFRAVVRQYGYFAYNTGQNTFDAWKPANR